MQQNSVNQIFNPCSFFFFFFTGATWYYHAVYSVFTYFASFTGYTNDILKLFLICMFKYPNLAENLTNLGEFFFNWTPQSLWSLFLPSLVTGHTWQLTYDTWHLTLDRWAEVNLPLKVQLPSSCGLRVKVFCRYFHTGLINRLISDKGVCRTPSASSGLLNILQTLYIKVNYLSLWQPPFKMNHN